MVGSVDKAGQEQEPSRAGETIRDSGGVSQRRLGILSVHSCRVEGTTMVIGEVKLRAMLEGAGSDY
jgi:hypothetical protein